jgi:hypothetical protein
MDYFHFTASLTPLKAGEPLVELLDMHEVLKIQRSAGYASVHQNIA